MSHQDGSPLITPEDPGEREADDRNHHRTESMDIDTSSLSMPYVTGGGSINIDAMGDVFTVTRDGLVTMTPNAFGRSTPWQYTSASSLDEEPSTSSQPSLESYSQFVGLDETSLVQAVVFIEDAYKYRSIHHKVDESCLRLYRHYHSTSVHAFRYIVIFLLHILAFFETPSSLTWTSDLRSRGDRVDIPCWLTQSIELLCLFLLLTDNLIRCYLMGRYYFLRHKWDMGAVLLLLVSLVDWAVSAGMGCSEVVRFRRILRPYFIVQNSSLMKKIVNCLRMSLPEVISVLIMLAMHLYIFTLFGMLLFPTPEAIPGHHNRTMYRSDDNNVTASPIVETAEGNEYFKSLLDSFMSLLVLLTTANNPDVTMPAYSRNRLFSLFFIIFLIIGLYCFMNMLTAVIYNQFRGYFLSSMQSSLNRRRLGVRAAFEVLRRKKRAFKQGSPVASISNGVGGFVIRAMVEKANLPPPIKNSLKEKLDGHPELLYSAKDFQQLFLALDMEIKPPREVAVRWFQHPVLRRLQKVVVHKYFSYLGICVAFCNVLIISIELAIKLEESFDDNNSDLRATNFFFVNYYLLEQLLKLWAMGWRRFIHDKGNVFDAIITVALVCGELYSAFRFGVPFFYRNDDEVSLSTLWNVLRIINILIMVRLLRIVPHIKSMRVIASVLMDLVSNMKAFAGVLIVIYYAFAILGMELFHGAIVFNNVTDSNATFDCGTYRQLQYWANNFDDFAASVVVLWDVMVVNNWMVFLAAYRLATSAWSYVYFVAWWLISVIIVMNLFTALIMENFIMKWDRSQQMRDLEESLAQPVVLNSVHDMFRGLLEEPADNELLKQLSSHKHLSLER